MKRVSVIALLVCVLQASLAPAFAMGSELLQALDEAQGGDTILLPTGDYGDVVLRGLEFSKPVLLKPADPKNSPRFQSLEIEDVRGLHIDGIVVANPGNGDAASRIVSIENSHDVALMNSDVHGKVDAIYDGHYGIFAEGNTEITISGNTVHDVKNGVVVYPNQRIEISENHVDTIGNDAFKFIGIRDFLIENNSYGGHVYPQSGAHLDFMQFQGAESTNGVIRGNVFLAATHANVQGIFLDDVEFHDILIEQNIIATGMINGIAILGTTTSNITVRDNTLIHLPGTGSKATLVIGASSRSGNLVGHIEGGIDGDDMRLQMYQRGRAYHYNTAFRTGLPRLGMTLEDLRPIKGGPADIFGARRRLDELLNQQN